MWHQKTIDETRKQAGPLQLSLQDIRDLDFILISVERHQFGRGPDMI